MRSRYCISTPWVGSMLLAIPLVGCVNLPTQSPRIDPMSSIEDDAAALELRAIMRRSDNGEPKTLTFVTQFVDASRRVMTARTCIEPKRTAEFALDHFRRCLDLARTTTLVREDTTNLGTFRAVHAAAEAARLARHAHATIPEADVRALRELLDRVQSRDKK
jgi:hypothetical protein